MPKRPGYAPALHGYLMQHVLRLWRGRAANRDDGTFFRIQLQAEQCYGYREPFHTAGRNRKLRAVALGDLSRHRRDLRCGGGLLEDGGTSKTWLAGTLGRWVFCCLLRIGRAPRCVSSLEEIEAPDHFFDAVVRTSAGTDYDRALETKEYTGPL